MNQTAKKLYADNSSGLEGTEDVQKIRAIFIREAKSLSLALGALVLDIDRNPGHKKSIDQLFRAMHTMKAAAASVPGASSISQLAHECESLLDLIKQDLRPWTSDLLPLFLDATDKIVNAIEQVADGHDSGSGLEYTTLRLRDAISGAEHPLLPQDEYTSPQINEGIYVRPSVLDDLRDSLGSLIAVRNQLQSFAKHGLNSNDPESHDLMQIGRSLGSAIDDLAGKITEVRKVPLSEITMRLRRVGAELSHQLEKSINIVVIGDDLLVDRETSRSLQRALEQIVRNSCDHGIEAPNLRESLGKNPQGTVTVNFAVTGFGVQASISDNGGGIDLASIRDKATVLCSPETNLAEYSDEQILDLIFLDGLSTADEISNVSGRGMGLSAARTELTKLGGNISVSSQQGRGTKFILTVPHPSDESITRVIIARAGSMHVAIAVDRVVDVNKIDINSLATVERRLTAQFRGVTVPLSIFASDSGLGLQPVLELEGYAALMMVVSHRGKWHGIVIDGVVDQMEITIHPITSLVKKIQGVRGVAIIPGKELAYVLDPSDFMTGANHV